MAKWNPSYYCWKMEFKNLKGEKWKYLIFHTRQDARDCAKNWREHCYKVRVSKRKPNE